MQYNQSYCGAFPNYGQYGQFFPCNTVLPSPTPGPEVVGEGEVTTVLMPDGSTQLYFMPTNKWGNSLFTGNCCQRNNPQVSCLPNLGVWFIRSVSNPIPHPVLQQNYPLTCGLPIAKPNCRNRITYPSNPESVKFHNDGWTSTTDLRHFFPRMRSCYVKPSVPIAKPTEATGVQVSVPMESNSTVCHCEVVCCEPYNCPKRRIIYQDSQPHIPLPMSISEVPDNKRSVKKPIICKCGSYKGDDRHGTSDEYQRHRYDEVREKYIRVCKCGSCEKGDRYATFQRQDIREKDKCVCNSSTNYDSQVTSQIEETARIFENYSLSDQNYTDITFCKPSEPIIRRKELRIPITKEPKTRTLKCTSVQFSCPEVVEPNNDTLNNKLNSNKENLESEKETNDTCPCPEDTNELEDNASQITDDTKELLKEEAFSSEKAPQNKTTSSKILKKEMEKQKKKEKKKKDKLIKREAKNKIKKSIMKATGNDPSTYTQTSETCKRFSYESLPKQTSSRKSLKELLFKKKKRHNDESEDNNGEEEKKSIKQERVGDNSTNTTLTRQTSDTYGFSYESLPNQTSSRKSLKELLFKKKRRHNDKSEDNNGEEEKKSIKQERVGDNSTNTTLTRQTSDTYGFSYESLPNQTSSLESEAKSEDEKKSIKQKRIGDNSTNTTLTIIDRECYTALSKIVCEYKSSGAETTDAIPPGQAETKRTESETSYLSCTEESNSVPEIATNKSVSCCWSLKRTDRSVCGSGVFGPGMPLCGQSIACGNSCTIIDVPDNLPKKIDKITNSDNQTASDSSSQCKIRILKNQTTNSLQTSFEMPAHTGCIQTSDEDIVPLNIIYKDITNGKISSEQLCVCHKIDSKGNEYDCNCIMPIDVDTKVSKQIIDTLYNPPCCVNLSSAAGMLPGGESYEIQMWFPAKKSLCSANCSAETVCSSYCELTKPIDTHIC